MKRCLYLPILFELAACGSLGGTYREKGERGRLQKQLTLFPDSTYQYTWWTDIIMAEQGRWSLAGDTLVLEYDQHRAMRFIHQGQRLLPLNAQGSGMQGLVLKRSSSRCDTLFWEH